MIVMLRYDDGVMVACSGMEPGSYWGWCIVDDVGDSEADDANAVNVKGSGIYVRVAAFTGSSRIVCKYGLVAVG